MRARRALEHEIRELQDEEKLDFERKKAREKQREKKLLDERIKAWKERELKKRGMDPAKAKERGIVKKLTRGGKKAGKVFTWTLGKAHEGKLELNKPLRERGSDWENGYTSKFENQHWSIGDFQLRESDRYKMNVENAASGKMIDRTKRMDEKGNREDRYQETIGFSQRNLQRQREELGGQNKTMADEIGGYKDRLHERSNELKNKFLGKKGPLDKDYLEND